jgi:KilA-N domain
MILNSLKRITMASASRFITKTVQKRNSKCLRCDHEFKFPCDLYRHLYNNKTDCKIDSKISIEDAKKHANVPDYYKCKFCKDIIIDKQRREEHELICDKKDIIDTFSVNNVDPLTSYLFATDEDGNVITNIDKETGYINATLMCKSAKKELVEYFSKDSTNILIKELEKYKNNPVHVNMDFSKSSGDAEIDSFQSLVFEKPSILNAKVNHTYVQEMIAIDLASWCNVKYKIIVYNHIINYNKGLIKTEDSKKAKQDIKDINDEIIKINITSSKDYTNKHSPQFYMRKIINKPSEVELYDSLGNRIINDEYSIFKGGSQGDHTGRQGSHITNLKGSIHLDSIECFNYTKLEEYVKDIAREMNILCAIQNSGKELNGTEYYIFKTQEEYDDFINKISNKSNELNRDAINNNDLEIENIKLKQKEEETAQEKEKTRQLELQLKIKELEIEKPKKIEKECKKIKNATYDKDYIGVTKIPLPDSGETRYLARLFHNGKQIYLGKYKTPEEAAYAYDCKKKELNCRDDKLNNLDLSKRYVWNPHKNRIVSIRK